MGDVEPFFSGWYQIHETGFESDYGGLILEVYESNIGHHWFSEITFWDNDTIVRQHETSEQAKEWCIEQATTNYRAWEAAYINSDE